MHRHTQKKLCEFWNVVALPLLFLDKISGIYAEMLSLWLTAFMFNSILFSFVNKMKNKKKITIKSKMYGLIHECSNWNTCKEKIKYNEE